MPREEVDYKAKEDIVEEFVVRWWYALPQWPPEGISYGQELKKRKLRAVALGSFKVEPEFDGQKLRKVYEVMHFPGVFKDSEGKVYDLRPQDTKPSLNNFLKYDIKTLQSLLLKAYQG